VVLFTLEALVSWRLLFKLTIMIYYFIITILFIYGVHATTRSNMIFYPVSEKIFNLIAGEQKQVCLVSKRQDLAVKILKPLFDCTPCMASIYGTLSYFLFIYSTPGWALYHWPVWVFCMSGTNYLINKLTNK
jgi:hypothetical protein